mmetsp:Transcript_22598/g.57699  ORF Transcript_22598/g.57699 Transcript_22598/m.57699 type:complete len:315 (-) Transcript_22598:1132-2076(-)
MHMVQPLLHILLAEDQVDLELENHEVRGQHHVVLLQQRQVQSVVPAEVVERYPAEAQASLHCLLKRLQHLHRLFSLSLDFGQEYCSVVRNAHFRRTGNPRLRAGHGPVLSLLCCYTMLPGLHIALPRQACQVGRFFLGELIKIVLQLEANKVSLGQACLRQSLLIIILLLPGEQHLVAELHHALEDPGEQPGVLVRGQVTCVGLGDSFLNIIPVVREQEVLILTGEDGDRADIAARHTAWDELEPLHLVEVLPGLACPLLQCLLAEGGSLPGVAEALILLRHQHAIQDGPHIHRGGPPHHGPRVVVLGGCGENG